MAFHLILIIGGKYFDKQNQKRLKKRWKKKTALFMCGRQSIKDNNEIITFGEYNSNILCTHSQKMGRDKYGLLTKCEVEMAA